MKHLISLGLKYVRRQKLRTLLTFLCVTLSVFILCTFGAYCGSIFKTLYNQEVSDSGTWEANMSHAAETVISRGADPDKVFGTLEKSPLVTNSLNSYIEFLRTESDDLCYLEFDDGNGVTSVEAVSAIHFNGDPEITAEEMGLTLPDPDTDGATVPRWLKERGYSVGDTLDFTIRTAEVTFDEDSPVMKEIRSELLEKYGTSVLPIDPEWKELTKEEVKKACPMSIDQLLAEKGIEYKDYPVADVKYSDKYHISVKIGAFEKRSYGGERFIRLVNYGTIEPLLREAEQNIGGSHHITSYVSLNKGMDFDDALIQLCNSIGYTSDDYYDNPPDTNSGLLMLELRSADAIVGLIGFIIPFMFFLMLFWLVSRFVIDNAFEISAAERSTQYAALRIMGASKGQIAAVVLTEAVFYIITAVPVGTAAAYLLCRASINTFHSLGFSDFEFCVNKWVTILVIALCVIAIFISAYTSSMWATRKLSPSEALNFGKPKSSKKKLREHKSKLKLSSRGFISRYTRKNIMRSKNRFIIATITMTIGVVLFTTSVVTAILAAAVIQQFDEEMPKIDYDICYNEFNSDLIDQAEKVFNNDNVFSRTVIRSGAAYSLKANGSYELGEKLDKYMAYHYFGEGRNDAKWVEICGVTRSGYDKYFAELTGISYDEFAQKEGGFLISSIYGNLSGRTINDEERLSGYEKKYEAGAVIFDEKVEIGEMDNGYMIELAGTICCGNSFYSEGSIVIAADAPKATDILHDTYIYLTVNGSKNHDQASDIVYRFMKQYPIDTGLFDDMYVSNTGRQDFMFAIAKTIAILVFSVWMVGILSMVNSINTSVLNRSRELMMLRSVGMTKKQLRKTVFQESLMFSSVSSAAGVILSIFFVILFCKVLYLGTEFMAPAVGAIAAAVALVILLNTVIAAIAAIPGIRSLERAEALTKAV